MAPRIGPAASLLCHPPGGPLQALTRAFGGGACAAQTPWLLSRMQRRSPSHSRRRGGAVAPIVTRAASQLERLCSPAALQLCPDSMAAFHSFSRARVAFGAAAALGVAALLFHLVAGDLVDQWKPRDAMSLQASICRDICKLVSRGVALLQWQRVHAAVDSQLHVSWCCTTTQRLLSRRQPADRGAVAGLCCDRWQRGGGGGGRRCC